MDIAYQVLGAGPTDLLVLPGPFVPIGSIDDEPSMYRFHRRLASFCRVIRFDHRGIGLSSGIPSMNLLGPKYWAEDAIAVIDAVGCGQVTIFAPTYHAMNGLVLAADYPERVRGLVIVNGAARTLWAPDYPAGFQGRGGFQSVAFEPDAVEQGFDVLRMVAPSVAHDDAFRAWWDLAGNRAGPPSMARVVSKVVTEADVREALGRISAPTLILHRVDSAFIPVGHAHYLAEHIAGSRYVELSGADALYWVGDTAPMLDEIEEFITGVRGGFDAERVLAAIVFTDIVGSTERAAALGDDRWRDLLDNHDTIVRRVLQRFGGREVNTAGDGFVATFVSPSAAIACADELVDRCGYSASRCGWGFTPARSSCAAPTSPAWPCTSVHGWPRWRDRAKCWCPRRCATSSRARGARSPNAANANSKACPARGGCTPLFVSPRSLPDCSSARQ